MTPHRYRQEMGLSRKAPLIPASRRTRLPGPRLQCAQRPIEAPRLRYDVDALLRVLCCVVTLALFAAFVSMLVGVL